jgi:molybdopterin molybdotransferase
MHDDHGATVSDVRMRGFARRTTVEDALAWLDAHVRAPVPETVSLSRAAARVLAAAAVADVDVPGFDRATMDGYAVSAHDTEGATPYNRLPLDVIGDALPGKPFAGAIHAGQAVRIMTGAPMPQGCDAVLPAEWAERVTSTEADSVEPATHESIGALASVSPGKHVGRRGEDITSGTVLLHPGRVLRPQDLGLLSSIGMNDVAVSAQPRVRLVITGNELLPAGTRPRGYQIADANGPMLQALVTRDGGIVESGQLVRDDPDAILRELTADADVILVSGGSSVGLEDLAPSLLARHGELPIHGIAMRPSSPTGLGRIGDRLVFLLPGNPVSCLCAYDFFAGRAIRLLGGRRREWPYRCQRGTLSRKISSPIGRLDYARVQVRDEAIHPLAVGGASVLSSTTRADGFVIVPADSEGFPAGSAVDVWLYA